LIDCRFRQPAGLDPDVGAHDCVGVAVTADDLIDTGVEPDDLRCWRIGKQEKTFVRSTCLGGINIKAHIARRQRLTFTHQCGKPQATGIQGQRVPRDVAADGHLLGDTGSSVCGMNIIITRTEAEGYRSAVSLADKPELAGVAGVKVEDTPCHA
jgi:hypothetical protein